MQGHLGHRDLCLNKLGNGPLGMHYCKPNFKHLSKVVLGKKAFVFFYFFFFFFFFFCIFYGSNLGPCRGAILDPVALI